MKLIAATIALVPVLALPVMPALAQERAPPEDGQITLQQQVEDREKRDQQRRDEATQVDREYQRMMKSSPTAPRPKVDPWGGVR
jgi:hypothetical protein